MSEKKDTHTPNSTKYLHETSVKYDSTNPFLLLVKKNSSKEVLSLF
jgi:hypothetical protein